MTCCASVFLGPVFPHYVSISLWDVNGILFHCFWERCHCQKIVCSVRGNFGPLNTVGAGVDYEDHWSDKSIFITDDHEPIMVWVRM